MSGALKLIGGLLFSLLLLCPPPSAAGKGPKRPSRDHVVYFAGTPNELNVYQVYGAQDGKTLMLIGGIQGDEPGGFLSADLYTDISLAKGNLIVVPRANFYSIIMNHRGPDGDMNRQFGDPVTARRHKKIVKIIKSLIAQADLLLNLHDGSGFYRPTWEGPMANPRRYGQSIIADTDIYQCPDGRVLDLKAMALRVLSQVNARIEQPRYHILFNNHRTASADSLHKEQRKSATFYALTHCHVPAFGVESSKSLPSTAMKIRHHNLVINAFMRELGIVPENPPVKLIRPLLKYLVIGVNDQMPVVVPKGASLRVSPGDRVQVLHIEANYERGLTCDLLGMGSINDLRRAFTIRKPCTVVVRKDHQEIGRVSIRPSSQPRTGGRMRSAILYFLVDVDGQRRVIASGQKLRLVRGDRLKLVELLSNLPNPSAIQVNFKGFVPRNAPNQGEDRGRVIDTGRDLMRRYSRCPAGTPKGHECYRVVATHRRQPIGSMMVEIAPARLQYLVLRRGVGQPLVYNHGDTIKAGVNERLEIVDIKTNVSHPEELSLALASGKQRMPLTGQVFSTSSAFLSRAARKKHQGLRLLVMRQNHTIGHVRLQLGGVPNAGQ